MGGEDLPVPWKAETVWEERVRFVVSVVGEEAPLSVLCMEHGISRQTGYKWLARYREGGVEALRDASRAPHGRPHALDGAVAEALLLKRRERPRWGPRKLLAVLRERRPEVAWPAASTVGELLKRSGLVEDRVRRRRLERRERG